MRRLVVTDHLLQAKLTTAIVGQGQANQAARVADHEVDGFRRDMLGRHDQVAFVLAIFLINQDDHAASLQLRDDFFNGGEAHSNP